MGKDRTRKQLIDTLKKVHENREKEHNQRKMEKDMRKMGFPLPSLPRKADISKK